MKIQRSVYPVLYVVYDHPKDYPEFYVVRRWFGETPEQPLFMHATELDQIHHTLAGRGLSQIPVSKNDDPVIIETWI